MGESQLLVFDDNQMTCWPPMMQPVRALRLFIMQTARGEAALFQSEHQGVLINTGKALPPKVKIVRKPDILKSRYVTVIIVAMGNSRCQTG